MITFRKYEKKIWVETVKACLVSEVYWKGCDSTAVEMADGLLLEMRKREAAEEPEPMVVPETKQKEELVDKVMRYLNENTTGFRPTRDTAVQVLILANEMKEDRKHNIGYGSMPIVKAIKALREITHWNLKESKFAIEYATSLLNAKEPVAEPPCAMEERTQAYSHA